MSDTTTPTAPVTVRLPLEIRTKRGKLYETLVVTIEKSVSATEADFTPYLLEMRHEHTFGDAVMCTKKRMPLTLDNYDPEKRIATLKRESIARSDAWYDAGTGYLFRGFGFKKEEAKDADV